MQHMANFSAGDAIQITMLGGFSIRWRNDLMSDSIVRSNQLSRLIEYLIAFRQKPVALEEFSEILWPEGDVDSPASALKNLVYRARTALREQGFPYAKDIITHKGGSYQWNNSLPSVVDAEEFERLYRIAVNSGQADGLREKQYAEAIRAYKGDFLPDASSQKWVGPIANRYRAMYLECVHALLEIWEPQSRHTEIEALCRNAVQIDPFDETVQGSLILSLMCQGRQTQALAHYSDVTDMFFRERGTGPSAPMRELYREIAKSIHDVKSDLSAIKEELMEPDEVSGAFFCEYEVFKSLYRLDARSISRTGMSIFIGLLTLEDSDGNELDAKLRNQAMDCLFGIIRGSLRMGDVYARFSASQYVLMLYSLTYENCAMVMQRIIKRFNSVPRNKNITIRSKIQPIDAARL